jgi:hypothetical protein
VPLGGFFLFGEDFGAINGLIRPDESPVFTLEVTSKPLAREFGYGLSRFYLVVQRKGFSLDVVCGEGSRK